MCLLLTATKSCIRAIVRVAWSHGLWATLFFIFPTCRHTQWSLVQNLASLHTRVNVILKYKHGDLRLHASATLATTRGDTPLMPVSVVPNPHPRAEAVPAWRDPLRSAEQQGRSDVLPFRQSTGTALRRHVRLHRQKIQHRRATLPKRPRGLPLASFWLRTATEVRVKRHRMPYFQVCPQVASNRPPDLSVFPRVVGDMASTVFNAMLALASTGKNSTLMLDPDPLPTRPKRHHTLIMRRRRWRRNDCDAHLTA